MLFSCRCVNVLVAFLGSSTGLLPVAMSGLPFTSRVRGLSFFSSGNADPALFADPFLLTLFFLVVREHAARPFTGITLAPFFLNFHAFRSPPTFLEGAVVRVGFGSMKVRYAFLIAVQLLRPTFSGSFGQIPHRYSLSFPG